MYTVHGVVPFFLAVSEESGVVEGHRPREDRLSRFWFREVEKPFRRGVGIAFGHYAVGVCWPTRARSEEEVVGSTELDFTASEIAHWRGKVET